MKVKWAVKRACVQKNPASNRREMRANKGRENRKRKEKENGWSSEKEERAWKQNEGEVKRGRKRERTTSRQFDTFLLCNARVIITGVRDGRLIMTFWMQVSDDEIRVICLSSSLRVSSRLPPPPLRRRRRRRRASCLLLLWR